MFDVHREGNITFLKIGFDLMYAFSTQLPCEWVGMGGFLFQTCLGPIFTPDLGSHQAPPHGIELSTISLAGSVKVSAPML